jgi:hypothetical protein
VQEEAYESSFESSFDHKYRSFWTLELQRWCGFASPAAQHHRDLGAYNLSLTLPGYHLISPGGGTISTVAIMNHHEKPCGHNLEDDGCAVCPHFSRTFSGTVGIKHCRKRKQHVPTHGEPGWQEYLKARQRAMKIAIQTLARMSLGQNGLVESVEFTESVLTFQLQRQSKLSQQDLADLQAATKFDKKELQQWYKGK